VERSGRGLIKALSRKFPGGTEEDHEEPVRIAGLRAEIWTRDLRNTKPSITTLGYDIMWMVQKYVNNLRIVSLLVVCRRQWAYMLHVFKRHLFFLDYKCKILNWTSLMSTLYRYSEFKIWSVLDPVSRKCFQVLVRSECHKTFRTLLAFSHLHTPT
jgi:hypothetical protein